MKDMGVKMGTERSCIYKHTCGFDICMKSDCPYYEPKTKGKKWFEEMADTEIDFDYEAED